MKKADEIRSGQLVLTRDGDIDELIGYEASDRTITTVAGREIPYERIEHLGRWLVEQQLRDVSVTVQKGWVDEIASRPSLIGMDNTIAKLVQAKNEYQSLRQGPLMILEQYIFLVEAVQRIHWLDCIYWPVLVQRKNALELVLASSVHKDKMPRLTDAIYLALPALALLAQKLSGLNELREHCETAEFDPSGPAQPFSFFTSTQYVACECLEGFVYVLEIREIKHERIAQYRQLPDRTRLERRL